MKKLFLTTIFSIFLFISFNRNVLSQNFFDINLKSTYLFDESGHCKVNNEIEIINKTTEKYAPSFEFIINKAVVDNPAVLYNGNPIKFQYEKGTDKNKILINFEDKVLGKNKKRIFEINFTSDNLAQRTGKVWEISTIDFENLSEYKDIDIQIVIPKSFGNEAYIIPRYKDKLETPNNITYFFSKEEISLSKIIAGFGEFQTYSFIINYRLKNDLPINSQKSVAIPPDTAYQRIFYEKINPQPLYVLTDDDENWLAFFKLGPSETIDIEIRGYVQIFPNPRNFFRPDTKNLYENIKPNSYWTSDNPQITELAKKLQTPQKIFEYVSSTLKYNIHGYTGKRKGALEVLANKENSICTDYSDLLISLLRSAGIPSREVVGFAYSDNEEFQSKLFFEDILHSWVEYWNPDKENWIAVDPTWASATKTDYFNSFDHRHFAFVIHGKDPMFPLPPGMEENKVGNKNIYINYADIKKFEEKPLSININFQKFFLFNRVAKITLSNPNNFALYDKEIKIYSQNQLVASEFVRILPPYSKLEKNISFKYNFLAKNTPKTISVKINQLLKDFEGPYLLDLTWQLLTLFSFFCVTIFIFSFKKFFPSKSYEKP